MNPVDLLRYLPQYMAAIREMQAIAGTENPELERQWTGAFRTLDNLFIGSMDAYGIGRWEEILGIVPFDTDTLEARRFRVKALFNQELPYTYKSLQNMLASLCGADGYAVTLEAFEMEVKVSLTVKRQKAAVEELLERVVPAAVRFTVSLMYNRHRMVGRLTHRQLAKYTHRQIREDVLEVEEG